MLAYELEKMTELERELVLTRGDADLGAATDSARRVIAAVRAEGDSALLDFARRFDGFTGDTLTIPESEVEASVGDIDEEILDALKLSKGRIEAFHSKQALTQFEFEDDMGIFGQKVVPLDRVGVYVPGGTAAYMSSVLMACVPARVAGVKEIAMCTPGKGGKVPSEILAAAELCGVREIHPVGGAQAIAALAYGTESIRRVQKIVGPGGVYVSAAKLLVRNDCEIDFLAGPSEVLVIADASADPEMVALDMLAQLEHDQLARALLVSISRSVIQETEARLEGLLSEAARAEIASKAARTGAIFIFVKDLDTAAEFANEYAPEHLLLDVEDPKALLGKIRNAGSVFLGGRSSVAFGDYCSGTNHILPTKGAASNKSSLSVFDFVKIIPYQSISASGATRLSGVVDVLARAEGLPAHANAALARARKEVNE
jgi:histidinol dehydrogenase